MLTPIKISELTQLLDSQISPDYFLAVVVLDSGGNPVDTAKITIQQLANGLSLPFDKILLPTGIPDNKILVSEDGALVLADYITQTDIQNWNEAYSWGDHMLIGYITEAYGDSRYRIVTQPVPLADVTGLQIALDGKQPLDADLSSIASLTGTSGLLRKIAANTWSLDTTEYISIETDPVFSASPAAGITSTNISNWNTAFGWGNHASAGYLLSSTAASTYSPIGHVHSASDITSGTLSVLRGGTGISSYTIGSYIRASGINSLEQVAPATVLADIGAAAASHTHTISQITGLQTELDSKQATLISGTNIKTINGISILGSGNIEITTGDGGATSLDGLSDVTISSSVVGQTIIYNGTVYANAFVDYTTLINVPSTFTPSAHAHVISDVTGLQAALDGKQSLDGDLTSIAGLTGTSGLLRKTAANTWSLDTNTYALDADVVKLTGNQTIAGTKTFSSTISGSINGNAGTVTNGVYTTGNQTIGGTKTFSAQIGSSVATGTAPFSVTSTTRVNNLNVATAGTADTWTSARTITIGTTGKSVNGSANVSWSLAEIGAQAADADLTAIAALSGTSGLLRKTAADTWSLDTNAYALDSDVVKLTGNQTISGVKTFGTINATTVDFVSGSTEGNLSWNSEDGTLNITLLNGSSLQVGQEELLYARNETGGTLVSGQVVYISGAQGNRPTIQLASASTVSLSNRAIGVVTSTILNNNPGYVAVRGLVRELDTSAWAEGTVLWLGTTAGQLVSTKPAGPNRGVHIGVVARSHATEGSIYVDIQNSLILEELDNVTITSVAVGNVPKWNGTVWANGFVDWSELTGKPSTFTPSTHTHTISDVTGLQAALDTKQPLDADLTAIATLSGTSGLLRKTAADTWTLDTNAYALDSDVVKLSGNQTIAGTKTFSSTITGSINGNANTATTLSAARTITIGSTGKTFDGSANVSWSLAEIGAAALAHTHIIADITGLQTALDSKQATLVSGTNIKTINGESVLGSGNISITATPAGADTNVQFNDGGALGGSSSLTFNKLTNTLLSNKIISSDISGVDNLSLYVDNSGNISGFDVITVGGGTIVSMSIFDSAPKSIRIETAFPNPIFFDGSVDNVMLHEGNIGSFAVELTGNQTIAGTKTFSSTISGSINGNANTAATLATGRTITIGSTGKTFDGSANVSWSLAEIGAAAVSHTHTASQITDFNSATRGQVENMLANGTGISISYSGSGASRVATINATSVAQTLAPTRAVSANANVDQADSGTLVIRTAGNITALVPDQAGRIITIANNSSGSMSILAGSGVTLRLAGTAGTGTRGLAGYGTATLTSINTTTWLVSGPGVS